MKRIFITGGHFGPAKAILDKLSGWQVFYVGRKYAMEDDRALALEFIELNHLSNLKYLSILTGRLQRKFLVNLTQSLKALLKVPVGFIQSFYWLCRFRPKVVLSFGGYVALPVVISAWMLEIPIITHEQTQSLGLANKIISLFANKVFCGSLLRDEVLRAKARQTNTIYITGGNQGSHVVNLAVGEIIGKLVKKYRVIHQTGDSSYCDFEKTPKFKNYEVKKYLTSEESAKVLAGSKMVISRAGANTVAEIAYLGKPAIFIPIPWASANEQQKNAEELENLGAAIIIPQNKLSGKALWDAIQKISQNYDEFLAKAKKAKNLVDPHAAEIIITELNKIS